MKSEVINLSDSVFKIFSASQAISLPIGSPQNESLSFYKEDYESLLPHFWLRTQAVDFLIKILLNKAHQQINKIDPGKKNKKMYVRSIDAFVVTLIMTDQEDYILESLEPLNLFSNQTKYLIIPLNTQFCSGNHWLLGLLINQSGNYRLLIFDSGSGAQIGKHLSKRLTHLYKLLAKSEIKIEVRLAENLIYQTNHYDCGVYSIAYCQYILKEIVQAFENNLQADFTRLNTHYKYLLSNSSTTRNRYRQMVEKIIISEAIRLKLA